jgi:glycosyltransferase involved in cell wall biosynthesis
MKIWFPTIRGRSGADVYTLRLAEALQRHGVETEITWFHTYYQFVPFLLKLVNAPPGTDIVVANTSNGFAFKRPGIPLVVIEYHCVYDPLYRPHKNFPQYVFHEMLVKRFELASFSEASAIAAISEFTAGSLKRVLDIGNVQVIYNWLDTEKFKPSKQSNNEQGVPFKLLFVGNFSRRKGADLLKLIMDKLGEGFQLSFTSGLRGHRRRDCPKNMIPLGSLSEHELIRAYQTCDVLLFPSRFEGFGYAALEAMACGKPVIASNSSALPEVVEDGVTGILCADGDVDSYVDACRRLAQDRLLCEKLGNAGRERAIRYFSEKVIIQQFVALYESLTIGNHLSK